MSLKSGALLSLFTGVSFTDLQRAATRPSPQANAPTVADIAHATRFAGPSQVSVAVNDTAVPVVLRPTA